ncbi:universal stress protein [Minicystis rosea]|nr:universal stress protein [Minicystis rosea]
MVQHHGFQGPDLRSRVLVAIAFDASAVIAITRAEAMARVLDADLHVVHVVPGARWVDAIWPHRGALRGAPREAAVAVEAVHRLCEKVLGRPIARDRISVRVGAVVPRIVEIASQLDASLVVLGGDDDAGDRLRSHGIVRRVVREVRRPVLVARPWSSSRAIVAATDFSCATFPTLTRAFELGARLHAPVTFVHSVDTIMALVASSTFGVAAVMLGGMLRDAVAKRGEILQNVAERLGGGVDTIVLARENAAGAILEVARQRDADLIVVGSHRPDALGWLASGGTVEAVATTARRCVLTVPIEVELPLAA